MNRTLKYAAVLILVASPYCRLCAQGQTDPALYYGIKSNTLTVTEAGTASEVKLERPAPWAPQTKQAAAGMALVNTGIAAWNVVSGGAPSGAASSAYASALPPAFYLTWNTVAGWHGPKEYIYTYTVTNAMNVDVIKIKYKVSFYYGGTEDYSGRNPGPKDATGKYLTNFTVKAMEVNVKWGWHFNLDSKMSNPMNVGTVKNPVAFLQSDLQWTVHNILSSNSGIWSFTLDGNGKYRSLSDELQELTKAITPLTSCETPALTWN